MNLFIFACVLGAFLAIVRSIHLCIRLGGIPGPLLAKFTDLWRFRAQNSQGYSARLLALHHKYGYLVRLGPNHISVSDPKAVAIIYTTNPVWQKGPSYYGAVTVSNGRPVPSIIAMSEQQHTAVRKTVGRAFTTNSLLDYESYIDTSVSELVHVLGRMQTADIGQWLQLFAMDVLIRIAFTETPGFMQKGGDVDGILGAVMDRFDHWGRWAAMPSLDHLFHKSSLASRLKKKSDSPLARVGMDKFQARKALVEQPDLKDLCQKFLDGKTKNPDALSHDEILGIIMSTIGAGADTAAGTLTYTLFFLSKHPHVREKLQQELQEGLAAGTLSNPPRWNQVSKLPYLDAVLKESMRVYPIAAWGLDRVVPTGGAVIAGQFIPGGTVVGCQIDAVQQDRDVYGHDSATFRPERWLEADEAQKRQMDRCFLAFSTGKRICTGIHIAWLEMKKALPLILMNFDMDLMNPTQQLDDGVRISAVKYPPPIWMRITKKT